MRLLTFFHRGYNDPTRPRNSRVRLNRAVATLSGSGRSPRHARNLQTPNPRLAASFVAKGAAHLLMLSDTRASDGEFSNSIEMPLFEGELLLQLGERGHVRFGHSYNFAAGYVRIFLAALARVCLAQFSHVKRAGNAVVVQR